MIYEEEIKTLAQNLSGKRVILMGRGEHLAVIRKILRGEGIEIYQIWDNDTAKQGGEFEKIPISAPSANYSSAFIIIYSPKHWEAMYNQILFLGYDKNSVYVIDKPSFERNHKMIAYGFKLYEELCRLYGADARVFIVSGPLSDYYLLSLFFYEYCRINNIKKFVIVGDNKGIVRLSKFLGLFPTYELSAYDTAALSEVWKFIGKDENIRITPLTLWQGDFRFNPCIVRQLPGFTFMDTFKHLIFNLPLKLPT